MNGIEKELHEEVEVIRLNLWSEFGKSTAKRFEVKSAGTTVLLDGSGEVVYRHKGLPNRGEIRKLVKAS